MDDRIITLTEKLISELELHEAEKVYDALDILVSQVFSLNADEFEIIKKPLMVKTNS